MEMKRRYGRMLVNLLIAVIAILLLVFLLPKALVFFMPFVVGWIIAMIANPLVRFLDKRLKIRRKHGSAIIIVVVLAAVCALLYLVIALLVREATELVNDAPAIFEAVQGRFALLGDKFGVFYDRLPTDMQQMVDSLISSIAAGAESILTKIEVGGLDGVGNVVSSVVDVLLYSIIGILASYFFIADRDNISAWLKEKMPQSWYQSYELIKNNFALAVGGYFKAQFKIMLVLVVVIFAGLLIMGINHSFLFALLIAALDFFPVLGTGTILWPWMVIELLSGNYWRTVGLLAIYVVCQILRQILQPKMVGDNVGMSPLLTLFVMFVGYKIRGVFGMIVALPVGVVTLNLYRAGLFDRVINDAKTIYNDINRYRKGE